MTRQLRRNRKVPAALLVVALAALGVLLASGAAVQAAPSPDASVVDYSQCANGKPGATPANDPKTCNQGWIFGILNANNSQYGEDQGTGQRFIAELPKGGPLTGRTITLKYLVRKATHHAYDSLASWDLTIADGLTNAQQKAIACQNLNTPTTTDCNAIWDAGAETEPIPNDSSIVSPDTGVGSPAGETADHMIPAGVDRELRMFGLGTTGDMSVPTYGGVVDESGDLYESMTITYSLGGSVGGTDLDGNSDGKLDDNVKVMLLFSGHLASGAGPRSWGTNNGASFINGGPYHIKLIQLDSSSVGNRDNQIMAGAILPLTTTVTTDLHQTDSSGADVSPANNQGTGGGITVLPGSYVTDYATVTPTGATGTVSFRYYSSQTDCTNDTTFTGGTSAGSGKALDSNGVAKSDPVQFSSEGTFYWRAFFDGTGVSVDSLSSCSAEVLTVSKANPTLSTAPKLIPQDSATLSGLAGATPGGTVTFKLFDSLTKCDADDASNLPVYSEVVSVTGVSSGSVTLGTNNDGDPTDAGSGDTIAGYTITADGTFYWKVVYSGDTKNNSKTSGCSAEPVKVDIAPLVP